MDLMLKLPFSVHRCNILDFNVTSSKFASVCVAGTNEPKSMSQVLTVTNVHTITTVSITPERVRRLFPVRALAIGSRALPRTEGCQRPSMID